MEQFPTKYKNVVREVSGLSVVVQKDDSILKVDTSAGPCSILLLTIPTNIDLLYNVHIIDISDNASVNNITINTSLTDTINTQNSLVIDTNGGGCKIENLSQTEYVGTLNYTPTTAGGTDEKVKATASDTTSAYLMQKLTAGLGVSISLLNSGGNESLKIDATGSGVYVKTNAELISEITGNLIVPDGLYHITDAGETDGGCYLRGLTTNSVSRSGAGVFLNLDFQNTTGNFVGIWTAALTPTINVTRVGWNGLTYLNITGTNTAQTPNLDTTNWTAQDKKVSPTEYVKEVDFILYDIINNKITIRHDKRGNIIENFDEAKVPNRNSIEFFQWGNNFVFNNKVFNGSVLDNQNQRSEDFKNNVVSNSSLVQSNGFFGSSFTDNIIDNRSIVNAVSSKAAIQFNVFELTSTLSVNLATGGLVTNNHLKIQSGISATAFVSGEISYNTISDFSTIIADNATANIQYNTLIGRSARINAANTLSTIRYNEIGDSSAIDTNNSLVTANIEYNKLFNNSNLKLDVFAGRCQNNILDSFCQISCNLTSANPITLGFNTLINNSQINTDNAAANSVITNNYLLNNSKIESDRNSGTIDYNILKNESEIDSANNSGSWLKNILTNESVFSCNGNNGTIGIYSDQNKGNVLDNSLATLTTNTSTIGGLNLRQKSRFLVASNFNNIASFTMSNNATLSVTINNSKFLACEIHGGTITIPTNSDIRTNLTKNHVSNNWETTLDMSDVFIHTGNALTLSATDQQFGVFLLINGAGKKIETITGILPNQWDYKFRNNDTSGIINLDTKPVATAVANIGLIDNGGPNGYLVTGRTNTANGDNFVVYKTFGTGNPILKQVIIF